jgi:hypothetical protein
MTVGAGRACGGGRVPNVSSVLVDDAAASRAAGLFEQFFGGELRQN